jgi:diguanylate cyclase (GGDEF)-like protein/PAS domain S-box-containing protein
MSNPQTLRTQPAIPEVAGGATTTLVRADPRPQDPGPGELHPQLKAHLRELQLRTGRDEPDITMLLRLINDQYHGLDTERRGIAESMRLMADEARALAAEAREQSSGHLQIILDHIKDVVLAVGEEGVIRTFNPTGERVFGYEAAEVIGQRIDRLLPGIAEAGETVPAALRRLAATLGDTALDLASCELLARRKDGESFPAEIAVSKAPTASREMFVVCLRDVTERREAEEALRASEAKFRGLFESIAEGVYQSRRDGRLLSVNPAFVRMLGYSSAEELYALPSAAALYWNDADRAEFARRVEKEGELRDAEFLMRRRDGAQLVILENARAIRDAAGQITGYEGTIRDITARKRAEQAVLAEKERAQVTLESIGDAVISTDAEGRIEYINPVAESLTGWSLAEARGQPIGAVLRIVNELTREPIENSLSGTLGRSESGTPAEHAVLITRSGNEVAIQESAAPICDRGGRVIGAVLVFHDVTRERRLKRALSWQASHDALTGLINRREFDSRLHRALLSAQRGTGACALLYIDLDQFKVVNDTCGHQAGDRLLRDVTGVLQMRVRASDIIARLGGDEFGVLLESCTLEQATRIAEGVRQAIRDFRFVWGNSTLSVGASIGIVQIRAETENVTSIMSAADIACYAAKDAGRNRIHVYEPGGVGDRHREMHWVSRVTRAADDNRLELFFQPIVPLASGNERCFHELTVRLRADDGQLVPPSEFIPAAERYNVMSVIDRQVVGEAIELLRERLRRGMPLPLLALNLSGTSLNEQSFVDFVLQSVGDLSIASALCFEITETAAVTSLSNARYFMRELKGRGCKFALDDFGTGVSSFVYLKTLPVDFLKIDGQFIGQVAEDAVNRSMVEAIGKVARSLNIATIAECVENDTILAELKRIGVDFAQGFHLGAPQPIAQLS